MVFDWLRKRGNETPAAAPAPAAAPQPARAQPLPPDARPEWLEAFGHHQQGRLDEASRHYRALLARYPGHFDSRHLLGVVALQQGRLEEAAKDIALAIALDPSQAAAHSNLGVAMMNLGRFLQARESLEAALRLKPGDANAAANLGSVLMRLGQARDAAGRFREAIAAGSDPALRAELGAALLESGDAAGAVRELRAALPHRPRDASVLSNLGLALERSGDTAGALDTYAQALALRPGDADATLNRSALLAGTGRHAEALQSLEALVRSAPGSAAAWSNLGALRRDLGQLAEARAAFGKALALEPGLFAARIGQAMVLADEGDLAAAGIEAAALVQSSPRSADAHALQASVAMGRGDAPAAEAAARAAIAIDAGMADAWHTLGLARMAQGDGAGSREAHAKAASLDRNNLLARWAAVMAVVPPFSQDEASSQAAVTAFRSELAILAKDLPANAVTARVVGSVQPFYLAYHPGNPVQALEEYGQQCVRLLNAGSSVPAAPAAGRRVKVGIVSAQVADHSVWNAIVRGWIRKLDPARFELQVFSLGTMQDALTMEARQLASHFEAGPAPVAAWAERIRAAAPDILIYPEIGMNAPTTVLASQRLARVQVASWGHPLTTGLPTIDAYLSAAAMEPPDAASQYTEELVALPGLGVHYEPLGTAPENVSREALGLPAAAPLLLCPGTPQKYAAQHDAVWVAIARRLPQARLVFFRAGPPVLWGQLEQRLRAAFAAASLDFDAHVVFIERLSRPKFFGLLEEATVYLDSIGFSGFNTVMQAVECGLPIVTMEGDALRGRLGSGILREAGLDDCVATTPEAYADIAVALAGDPVRAADVRTRLAAAHAKLFAREEPVRALEQWLAAKAAG